MKAGQLDRPTAYRCIIYIERFQYTEHVQRRLQHNEHDIQWLTFTVDDDRAASYYRLHQIFNDLDKQNTHSNIYNDNITN